MSNSTRRLQKLARLETAIRRAADAARVELVGREATLDYPRSKYHGRKGVITEVMPGPCGDILALLMILRLDGKDYLNSDGDTRSYRPMKEMHLTRRRVFGPPEARGAA